LCEDKNYLNLLSSFNEAINTGINNIGIDAKSKDVAELMLEVDRSYECEH